MINYLKLNEQPSDLQRLAIQNHKFYDRSSRMWLPCA